MPESRTYTIATSDSNGEGVHILFHGGRLLKPSNGDPLTVDEIVLPNNCLVTVLPEEHAVEVVKHLGAGLIGKVAGLLGSLGRLVHL